MLGCNYGRNYNRCPRDVVEVAFEKGLPNIHDALIVKKTDGKDIVLEVHASDTIKKYIGELSSSQKYIRQEEITEELLGILGSGLFYR